MSDLNDEFDIAVLKNFALECVNKDKRIVELEASNAECERRIRELETCRDIKAAIAAEREACARVADAWHDDCGGYGEHKNMVIAQTTSREIAAAIRARGSMRNYPCPDCGGTGDAPSPNSSNEGECSTCGGRGEQVSEFVSIADWPAAQERIAELEAQLASSVASEREACAAIVEANAWCMSHSDVAARIAAAIRARGESK